MKNLPSMLQNDTIFSRKNGHIIDFNKLAMKKYRQQEQAFIVEGQREIYAALAEGFILHKLFFCHKSDVNILLTQMPEEAALLQISEEIMSGLSKKNNIPDAVAIFKQRWASFDEFIVTPQSFWIALESPKKPDNVGAIIRTAEASGASGVILLDDFCDPYTPESIRASTGAIFHIPILGCKAEDFIQWTKKHAIHIIGTGLDESLDYRHINYSAPQVLLMGTEYQGLSESLQKQCATRVTIPMRGKTNSLNLSVASAILLYQISNNKNSS